MCAVGVRMKLDYLYSTLAQRLLCSKLASAVVVFATIQSFASRLRVYPKLCLFVLGGFMLCGEPVVGQELAGNDSIEIADDAKLLEGLRKRRLFELADKYCEDLLAKKEVNARRKTILTLERLKTLTAMAVFASKEQRPNVWMRIDQIANRFESSTTGTRRLLVKAQAVLARVAEVRLIRQELDAKLVGPEAGKDAIEQLRVVRSRLESLLREIEKAIPTAPQDESDRDLTTAQLLELKTSMKFQFAVCNLERCRLYDTNDLASRADALSQAAQQIEDVTRSVQPGTKLWWEANLASSRRWRLAGKPDAAAKLFERLPRKSVPPELTASFLVEKLQVQQDAKDSASLERQLRELVNTPGREARLDLAILDAAVWLSENSSSKSAKWKSFATSMLKSIKSSHGTYWGRRAEIVLLGALDRGAIQSPGTAGANTDSDLTILIQLAESAQAEERFQVAADGFAKAIQLASQLNSSESVVQLAIRQSQCYENLGQHANAADSLFLAANNRSHNNAATAHLRGCWNLAQQLGQGSSVAAPKIAKRFQVELERHLVDWPESNSADTARVWLADHFRQRRRFQMAFDQLLQVRPDSPRFEQAIVASAEAAVSLLDQMQKNHQAIDLMTDRLLGRLTEKSRGGSSVAAMVELLVADIQLRFRGRMPDAEWLQKISSVDWSDNTQRATLAEAGQAIVLVGDFDRIEKFQRQVKSINAQSVLKRLDEYLASIWRDKKVVASVKANSVVTKRGRRIAKQQQDSAMLAFWQLRTADVQLALDENEAAIDTLKSLVEQFPRKADLRIKLAQAMTEVYGKSDPQKAVDQWRRLATKLRPQSSNWFLAKYQVALSLAEMGDRAAAAKLLKFMRANPPGWENSSLNDKFDSLLRQVDR